MENSSILDKIISKYLFEKIFSYINDKQKIFPYKLFKYSKLFQKKIGIDLFSYKKIYIEKRFFWERYLYSYKYKDDSIFFDRFKSKKKLEEKKLNYNISDNDLKNIVIDYLEKYIPKHEHTIIDFYSPLFDILSKTEIFEKKLDLYIDYRMINSLQLEKEYISYFDKINKSNVKFTRLYLESRLVDDINLDSFNINYSQIKNLAVTIKKNWFGSIDFIFSFKNLVSLKLYILKEIKISSDFIDQIKEQFKSLKSLELSGLIFTSFIKIKFNNLEHFVISCNNFSFEEGGFSQLKYLQLFFNHLKEPESLLKLPELEEISFSNNNYDQLPLYSVVDLKSLKNLKRFEGDNESFLLLEEPLLEKLILTKNIYNDLNAVKKIFEIKTLKEIELTINGFTDYDIIKLDRENSSIKKLNITFFSEINCPLCSLLKKFTNVTSIKFKTIYDLSPNLNLLQTYNDKLYEKLEEIEFNFYNREKKNKVKDFFPIFNEKCPIEFLSLIFFRLDMSGMLDIDILKNIYNNIDKMPNLKKFYFIADTKDVQEDFFLNFIKKVLSLKSIREIGINFFGYHFNFLYQKKELRKMFPEINLNELYIKIKKFIK